MEYYCGIDVSLEQSSVCVVDGTGSIVREATVTSDPDALIAWFSGLDLPLSRIGLEAGPLSQWLYAGLNNAGFAVELLETRHVRDAFKAMPIKTDRKDAQGIAQLMRLGWFRPVHCKSLPAQEVRAVLTARKLVQAKLHDVEMSLRGILRGFGLKVGHTTPRTFEGRIRELVEGHPTLTAIADALLAARSVLHREFQGFERKVRSLARRDDRARLLMSVPGVGRTCLTYLRLSDRRSCTLQTLQAGWRAFRDDSEALSVRGEGCERTDLQDRRSRCAHGAVRGSAHYSDQAGESRSPQELGHAPGCTRGQEQGQGCACAQARRDPAPHAGRWHAVCCRQSGDGHGLNNEEIQSSGERHHPPGARSRCRDGGSGQAEKCSVASIDDYAFLDRPTCPHLIPSGGGHAPTTDRRESSATGSKLK